MNLTPLEQHQKHLVDTFPPELGDAGHGLAGAACFALLRSHGRAVTVVFLRAFAEELEAQERARAGTADAANSPAKA